VGFVFFLAFVPERAAVYRLPPAAYPQRSPGGGVRFFVACSNA